MTKKEEIMATKNKITPLKPAEEQISREQIIELYMNYVLEHEKLPKTVFRFCKDNNITEDRFYKFFGSFEGLQKGIWEQFFDNTIALMERSPDYDAFTNREKLLTFYFTFFEMLTANRSYVLFILTETGGMMKNMEQLKGLRRKIKGYATGLIKAGNEEKTSKILQQSELIFSEAAWVQFMFLLKFWKDDNSAGFESTDVAIEKSVNTVFDIFDNTPLERVVDLGKFLWKEKMG